MKSVTSLGDILVGIEAGKSFLTSEILAQPHELGVLKVSAVTWSEFRSAEAKALLGNYAPSEHHRVRKGDLIISRANTKEFVGAVVYVDRDYPFRLLSDKTLRLIVDERRANKEFVLYALRSGMARRHIELLATGSSDSMRNISHRVIKSIPIRLPAIDAQRHIAAGLKAQLAEVSGATAALDLQVDEVKALTAKVYEAAYKGIAPVAVPKASMKAPANWRWHRLLDVAKLESGHTPSRSRSDWWGGDISWVSLTEIRSLDGKWVEETQIKTNEDGLANSSARLLPRGTVCFSRTASVGFVTILGKAMATSQDFANWICGPELDPEYLMHALIASRNELRGIATGATHKTIYMPELSSLLICAPEFYQQRRIASSVKASLDEIQELRSAMVEQRRELRDLPQHLFAQAFGA